MAVLLSVLAALLVLVARPFGFRTFLQGLGRDNGFALALVMAIIAVIFVIMQRLGLLNVKTDSYDSA